MVAETSRSRPIDGKKLRNHLLGDRYSPAKAKQHKLAANAKPVRVLEHDGIDLNVNPSDDEFLQSEDESDSGSEQNLDSGDSLADYDDDLDNTNEHPPVNDTSALSHIIEDRTQLEELIRNNQDVQQIVKEMVADEVKGQTSKKPKKGKTRPVPNIPTSEDNQGHEVVVFEESRKSGQHGSQLHNQTGVGEPNVMKSPSDMTLYTPTLKKARESNEMLNKIMNFVDSMRLESAAVGAHHLGLWQMQYKVMGKNLAALDPVPLGTRRNKQSSKRNSSVTMLWHLKVGT